MSIRLNGGGGRGTTDKEETEKELGEEVGEPQIKMKQRKNWVRKKSNHN